MYCVKQARKGFRSCLRADVIASRLMQCIGGEAIQNGFCHGLSSGSRRSARDDVGEYLIYPLTKSSNPKTFTAFSLRNGAQVSSFSGRSSISRKMRS